MKTRMMTDNTVVVSGVALMMILTVFPLISAAVVVVLIDAARVATATAGCVVVYEAAIALFVVAIWCQRYSF